MKSLPQTKLTHQYFGAQTRVEHRRRAVFSSFLQLCLHELAVSCGVVLTQIIQHGPKLVDLP